MRGGYREGSGRRTKVDEEKVRNQSIEAITKKYGSVEEGFIALLSSGEASLIKFVFEHAVGKPKEKLEHSTDPDHPLFGKTDEELRQFILLNNSQLDGSN